MYMAQAERLIGVLVDAASHRQFYRVTAHTDFLPLQIESSQLVLKTGCGIFATGGVSY